MGLFKETDESERQWKKHASHAPYRASVGNDFVWDVDRPHWNIASAWKPSSKGFRLLMAFELEEMRDYFVEGNRGQDVQIEPNGAEEASSKKAIRSIEEAEEKTLKEAEEAFLSIDKICDEKRSEVDRVFEGLLNGFERSEGLFSFIPPNKDTFAGLSSNETMNVIRSAYETISGLASQRITPTKEQAKAMLEWLRADIKWRETEKILVRAREKAGGTHPYFPRH